VRALLSVHDKTGLVAFARGLSSLGWELVASGGTARALSDAGIEHTTVEELTGAAEMLGGRVKTLHPALHGGILADRSDPSHTADLERRGIRPIDLVVSNLYPFLSSPGIETIDIGGPAMVRAAAKNHAHVGVVTDPSDYGTVLDELRRDRALSETTRRRLARSAFAHTAAYDAAIVSWMDRSPGAGGLGEEEGPLPPTIHLALEKVQELRYGENPHQRGARYREIAKRGWWDGVTQHGGMSLSYLNLFDAEAAWQLVHSLGHGPAAVIVKHANPCGVALANDIATAYHRAFECDPMSAFGGIVALSHPVTAELAAEMVANPKADVVIAPSFAPEALQLFASKRKNMRVLEGPAPGRDELVLRRIDAGFLVQEADRPGPAREEWRVVTKAVPTDAQWRDLELAWRVCAATTSNAIVVVSGGAAVGVGAGQQNRVEPGQIAVRKAGGRAAGASAASDAFFPFRDGLDVLAEAGVKAVVQPGGSLRDDEVVAAADEQGVAMVMTGERHFRH
jgi:phosphoribosylaminoimidazolecarboxamide formyltransferase/IMP cyclohydrolase